MNVDIAVIGGGLAGLSTIFPIIRSAKARVALIEGLEAGSNNPSPLTFSTVVKEFGLADCCKENYASFTFHNYEGSSIEFRFSSNQLVVLDYKKTCGKMLDEVRRHGNRFTYVKAFATSFTQNENEVLLSLSDGSSVRAKLLIDASGKAQFLMRSQHELKTRYYSHVYGASFSRVKNPKDKQCCFLLPNPEFGSGGGWFYSLGQDIASFGYATISDRPHSDLSALKENFERAVRKFKPYSEYLENAQIEHIESGVIPITPVGRLAEGNAVIIGDAAGMATNWTCMGVEPSLEYGRLAGKLSVQALETNSLGYLNNLQSRWDTCEKSIYDMTSKHAMTFWNSDSSFWEWVIKNDLSFLSPDQLLNRLRRNSHVLKWYAAILRGIRYRVLTLLDNSAALPKHIVKSW